MSANARNCARTRAVFTFMQRLSKISLAEKFASFEDTWSPKILATVGNYAVKAVKIAGPFVWHDHVADDELFFVVRGGIAMEYRLEDGEHVERFEAGEMLAVPCGIEHRPVADPGTEILLFERAEIVNTGDVIDPAFTHEAVRI